MAGRPRKIEIHQPFYRAMKRAGYENLKELAETSKVPYTTLLGYASADTSQTSLKNLLALADILEVTVERLIKILISKGYQDDAEAG